MRDGVHGTHLHLIAVRRVDVIQNIDMDIIENDAMRISGGSTVVEDISENDSSLGR